MSTTPDPLQFPSDIPEPKDDGAASHLQGMTVPSISLMGSDGILHQLDMLCVNRVILYAYPATGKPGWDPAPDWDSIPGAPGCTVQSLSFREHAKELAELGYIVIGLSSQSNKDQCEFVTRRTIPFLLLSDPEFDLAVRLRLPTFEAGGSRFYKRLVMVIEAGQIRKVFYPVFPPQESATRVLAWLGETPDGSASCS